MAPVHVAPPVPVARDRLDRRGAVPGVEVDPRAEGDVDGVEGGVEGGVVAVVVVAVVAIQITMLQVAVCQVECHKRS